jgi:hypothetical protein
MLSPLARPLLALALLSGCGGVGGDLSGASFDPVVGYWGGPFVVFSTDSLDCIDLWWVAKDYDEDEVPWDLPFDVLQVTFNESDVVEGTFDVSGVSPVSASRLTGTGEDWDIEDATSGVLTIDKVQDGGKVKGEMEITLASGAVGGSFAVKDCVNLTSAY